MSKQNIKIKPFAAGQFELPVIRVVLPDGPMIRVMGISCAVTGLENHGLWSLDAVTGQHWR